MTNQKHRGDPGRGRLFSISDRLRNCLLFIGKNGILIVNIRDRANGCGFFPRIGVEMVFSGLTFLLLFFPTVALLVLISRNLRWQNAVLLIASLVFYAWGEPKWILAMLAVTAVNYLCALPLQRETLPRALRRLLLAVGILAGLGFLIYFKYAAFFVNTVGGLFGRPDLLAPVALPIGISFYTFQALTYSVDVYRGKTPVQKNPLKLLLYVSCFPQLIAGPIVQYGDIAAQLDDRKITVNGYIRGFRRFCVGLAKKVLLANLCGSVITELGMADTGSMTVLGAWLGAILYSLQIYFDFSAYSDMAIGIGRMLGFTYKENFNYPYMADSITDFWRRWHISLGAFFRDYVYIPLGGNRVGKLRLVLNLLIVWGLTGLWHGASWNFILWGFLYGVLLIFEKLVLGKRLTRIPSALRRIFTLLAVMLGWVIFYYEDVRLGLRHIGALIGVTVTNGVWETIPLFDGKWLLLGKYAAPLLLMFVACTPLAKTIADRWERKQRKKRCGYELAASVVSIGLLALSLLFLIGQSYNPFIYFRF